MVAPKKLFIACMITTMFVFGPDLSARQKELLESPFKNAIMVDLNYNLKMDPD